MATLLSDRVPQLGLVQESHEYEEELDADALRTALDLLAERHEVLRTGVESRTDGFRARTEERVTVPLTVHRADGSGAAARRERARSHADAVLREGFDLSAPPLLKVAAFELERGRFTLVWTLHHVISDGWSWERRWIVVGGETYFFHQTHRWHRVVDSRPASTPSTGPPRRPSTPPSSSSTRV
ncbi:hypothetical protein SCALM49S_00310 [Streptomyces californicus]